MTDPKFMQHCEPCGTNVQFGAHIYDGKFIPAYKVFVCCVCYDANLDGWTAQYESAITRHLRDDGLSVPARNEKGWLPRDG